MILDVNYGSKEKIKAVEGDNLERIETIYLKANGEIVNLQGLTCDMAYMDITNIGVGNVIENLTISNPTGGEVQLPINSEITKRNGYYNCELRLKNSSGLIKHTAYFELEISKNIFNQIAKPILNSEGFKKIQEILSSIDTYNKDLENKLNTLSSLDSSNIEAKENIKNLQDNSNKAIELNNTLTSNVSSVDSKNKVLQDSLKQAEDFSKTLKNGTDFVQMRKDIDTLENNLKDTQSLSYSGSNITCNNSLEGRTTGLKLYGRTLQNFALASNYVQKQDGSQAYFSWDLNYSAGQYTVKNTTGKKIVIDINKDNKWVRSEMPTETSIITLNEGEKISNMQFLKMNGFVIDDNIKKQLLENLVILKGNYLDIIDNLNYFEGIKSVGEAEGNKISILTHGKNFFDVNKLENLSIEKFKLIDEKTNTFQMQNALIKNLNLLDLFNIDKSNKKGLSISFNSKKLISIGGVSLLQIEYQDGTSEYVGGENGSKFSKKLTKPLKAVTFSYTNGGTTEYSNVMINEGEISEFEPYQECKKEIQLQQPFAGLESIQDTIEETEKGVVLTQNIGKAVLDGTHDNWLLGTVRENTITFYFRGIYQSPYENDISIICNYPVSTEGFKQDIECIFKTSIGFYLSIKKSKLETQDIAGLKKWLQANPIIVFYQLAEQKKYLLKGIEETDVGTFNIITYVKSLNTIPCVIDFSICTNYGSLLMQHSAEINKIWDTIYNIVYPILTENAVEISKVQAKNLLN